MDATMKAGLDAAHIRQFTAIRAELSDGYVVNIIDGSGEITFPVDGQPVTFDGSDPVYGALIAASSIQEQIATDSPRFTFTMSPPSANALGSLSHPKHQGSSVRVWWGIVNEMTGAPIGKPELMWTGRLDIVRTQLGEGALTAEVETVSAFDRLYADSEAIRLNGVWHRSVWPDESGLDFNIAALSETYWGVEMNSRKGWSVIADAIAKQKGASSQF